MARTIEEATYCEETGRKLSDEVIECDCGTRLELSSAWCNTCDRCGREYNGSGQALAPREEWGKETDERYYYLRD